MIEDLDTLIMFSVFGIPICATLFYTWVVMGVLVLLSWLATRHLKTTIKVSKFQTAMEMIVMTIRGQIKDASNDNPMKYLPIMGTFFLFIALSNLMTIIPWFKAPTASLSTTGAFSLCVFFAVPYYGIKNAGIKKYLKKYISVLNIIHETMKTRRITFWERIDLILSYSNSHQPRGK